jgi:hypothetical protein
MFTSYATITQKIFPGGIFFCRVFFIFKTISSFFFLPTEYGITDESYADGRILLGI